MSRMKCLTYSHLKCLNLILQSYTFYPSSQDYLLLFNLVTKLNLNTELQEIRSQINCKAQGIINVK